MENMTEIDYQTAMTHIRVLLIIGNLGDGGKERQLLLLLKALKAREEIYTCLMIMNPGGEREQEAVGLADELVILPKRSSFKVLMPLQKVIQRVKKSDINLIHTWGSGFWDLLGVVAGRWCRVPVIHNGIRSAPGRLNLYNRLTQLGTFFADAAVSNSRAGLQSFNLADSKKSKVIHNGLDPSRFNGIQIIDEGQKLCMVANFSRAKDQKCLVMAMPEILKEYPDTKLYLVGHDYGTLNSVEAIINALELNDQISLVTDCSHPEPVIGACQVGILATNASEHGEGISNAILEYMALSKPVIASRNGGNAEVVVDQVTGFLVQPGSPAKISDKVKFLFKNPSVAQQMGQKGQNFVYEQFSLERMETEYVDLYKDMVD
jgi:glycosyltransferase involved in cell wall biosynthesis